MGAGGAAGLRTAMDRRLEIRPEGRAMTMDQAIAYALEEETPGPAHDPGWRA